MLPKPPRKGLQGALLTLLVAVSFVLCVIGFAMVDRDFASWRSWVDAVYHSFRIFSFAYDGPKAPEEVPDALRLGRVGALISVLWASWMAGVVILRERSSPLRLRIRAPEVVFCGMTFDLLRIALSQEQASPRSRMALLVADAASPLAKRFRQEISSLVVAGNPLDRKSLAACRVHRATRCVYVAGSTDTDTIAIVTAVATLLLRSRPRPQALQVVGVLRNRGLLQALPDILKNPDRNRIALNWVDPVIVTTRVLLGRLPPDSVAPGQPIHVLLAGSTALAETVLLQLARNAYPREQVTRVSVVAPDASDFCRRLLERYPPLDPEFADRGLFPGLHPLMTVKGFDSVPAVLADAELAAIEKPVPVTCAYAVAGNDGDTLLAVQRLRQLRAHARRDFPIGACLDESHGIDEVVTVIAERDVFHCRAGESYLGQHLDELAALHHYAYSQGRVPGLEAPTAEQQQAWEQAHAQWRAIPAWQRDSSRHVADHILVKLRHLGLEGLASTRPLTLETARQLQHRLLESLPQLGLIEHRRFCAERMLEGWLPVGMEQWNDASGKPVSQHQHELKALKLNATLTLLIDQNEVAKDELLAASIAWIFWQTANRPASH